MKKNAGSFEDRQALLRGLINIFTASLLSIIAWTFVQLEDWLSPELNSNSLLSIEQKFAIIVVGLIFCVSAILLLSLFWWWNRKEVLE